MYPKYTLCERQKKKLFEIIKLIFEIRKQVLCKHLWATVILWADGPTLPVSYCRWADNHIFVCFFLNKLSLIYLEFRIAGFRIQNGFFFSYFSPCPPGCPLALHRRRGGVGAAGVEGGGEGGERQAATCRQVQRLHHPLLNVLAIRGSTKNALRMC